MVVVVVVVVGGKKSLGRAGGGGWWSCCFGGVVSVDGCGDGWVVGAGFKGPLTELAWSTVLTRMAT